MHTRAFFIIGPAHPRFLGTDISAHRRDFHRMTAFHTRGDNSGCCLAFQWCPPNSRSVEPLICVGCRADR